MKSFNLPVSCLTVLIATLIASCTSQDAKEKENNMTQPMQDKQAPAFKSGYSLVNGLNMYYEIHGVGRPLVLIHGGGSTIYTTFGRILPLLAKNRQVIGVELQAHGHTSDRDTPLSFEQDADDVAALLQNLGISNADLLGFSNGGQTAMQIAIRHPEKVRKLIIASAFYKREGMPAGFWEGMNKAQFSDMPQAFKDEFLKVNNDSTALMTMFNRDVQRMQTFKDWSDKDIQSIRAASLLLIGDRDVASPEHTVAMSRLIPDCRLAIIPGEHGKFLGEITTLTDGKWTQEYITPLIEQFLDAAER